jgi:hypothetical protein
VRSFLYSAAYRPSHVSLDAPTRQPKHNVMSGGRRARKRGVARFESGASLDSKPGGGKLETKVRQGRNPLLDSPFPRTRGASHACSDDNSLKGVMSSPSDLTCRDLLSSSADLVRAGVQTVELEEAPSDDRNGT